VITEQRPLVGLFNKPIIEVENESLQHIRVKLMAYVFRVTWTQDKEHIATDALIRNPCFLASDLLGEDRCILGTGAHWELVHTRT
jgi:hypothetical protein